jgi:aryl-alcohol dehydrogenase-like predicted oxidoreductase
VDPQYLLLDVITNLNQQDTPLSQSIPALDSIRRAGKTKYIGLSECSAETLRKANSSTYHLNGPNPPEAAHRGENNN